jgi:hypothetical protein
MYAAGDLNSESIVDLRQAAGRTIRSHRSAVQLAEVLWRDQQRVEAAESRSASRTLPFV